MSSSLGISPEALESVSTPDRVDGRLGTLRFDDGAPSEETAALLYDHLDFMNGVQAFLGAIPGVSLTALRRGFRCSALFVGGYQFLGPPPKITAEGAVPYPSDGARKLDSRTNFFYMATGVTSASTPA